MRLSHVLNARRTYRTVRGLGGGLSKRRRRCQSISRRGPENIARTIAPLQQRAPIAPMIAAAGASLDVVVRIRI